MTLKLAFMALIIESVIGITAGVLAGIRRGKFIDNLVTVSTLFLISIPIFVIASVAQLIFGVRLGWFPVTATQGTWYQLIMPAFVLASASLAYIARLMRANLSENLRADYVRTAKAKGLTNRRTVGVHTLRNSLIPVITYIGIDIGALMGGAIVTERMFNVNGVGNFLFRSIIQKDGTSVVGTIVCLVLIYLLSTCSSTSCTASWTRGSPMTDTTRDAAAALDTESVVPITIDPLGGAEGPLAAPEKGEKARSLGSDAWGELRHRPMFWISAALIVFFVLMAAFPQLFTSTDPYLRRSVQGPRGAVTRTPGSAGTTRATTSTPVPSTAPGPRSWWVSSRPCSR